jgi:hypothetical protein
MATTPCRTPDLRFRERLEREIRLASFHHFGNWRSLPGPGKTVWGSTAPGPRRLTPYWEDGAGSSAYETALNRQSSDRLVQAEALYALKNPTAYPAEAFEDAGRRFFSTRNTPGRVLQRHRTGRKETKEQWEIKKSYADDADKQSRALLEQAQKLEAPATAQAGKVGVSNTLSWTRTELVVSPRLFRLQETTSR